MTIVVGYDLGYLDECCACNVSDIMSNYDVECCPNVVSIEGKVLQGITIKS